MNSESCSNEGRSGGLEGGLESSLWCSLDRLDNGEFDSSLCVLDGLLSSQIAVGNNAGLDDFNGLTLCSMSSSHIGVKLRNGMVQAGGSVFLVHVNIVSARSVSEHDAVVLNLLCFSLKNLQ